MIIGRLWSLNKLGNQDKVNHLSWRGLRFVIASVIASSSRQVGYHQSFVPEGNTIGEVGWWLSDAGRLVEFGRAIRITYRNEHSARSMLIRVYHCEFQYKRNLKAERQVSVQVVLLLTLTLAYQGMRHEAILKYGGRDISESSWVLTRSKDESA